MVQAIPEGVGNVVPYLCIRGAAKAIEYYKAAFGAEVMSKMPMGDNLIGHADLRIGSARVYLADEMPGWGAVKSPTSLKGTSANIHLWVEDCDATFARALAAGAKVAMPLTDQFWGDRYGMVRDPFGHVWAISSHKEDLTPEETMRRGQEAMAQMAQTAPKPAVKRAPRVKKSGSAGKAGAEAKPASGTASASASKAKPGKSKKKKKEKKNKKSKKDKKRKKKSKR